MIEDTLRQAESKMHKAIEVAKEEFSGIRTGRANPALVNQCPATERREVRLVGAGKQAPNSTLFITCERDD